MAVGHAEALTAARGAVLRPQVKGAMTTREEMLKTLLETVLDSIAGHAYIGDAIRCGDVHEHCSGQAVERQRLAVQLNAIGRPALRGASPDVPRGSMHRLFVNLDATLEQDDEATIKALQRGDALLGHRVATAIVEGQFDDSTEQIVRELCRTVAESQSRLTDLLASRPAPRLPP